MNNSEGEDITSCSGKLKSDQGRIIKEIGLKRYIGKKLCKARLAAGLTKMDLAQKIEVSAAQLGKYENGTDQISITRLFVIAEALSLDLNYFLADIRPTQWDEETHQNQTASLNVSNNFMQIKDKTCKKAISSLLAVLARIA